MNAIQRYELIRPILKREKTPKQVSAETGFPLSTIYRYLKRFREGSGNIENLADKAHASHWHPNWLTPEDKGRRDFLTSRCTKVSKRSVDSATHNQFFETITDLKSAIRAFFRSVSNQPKNVVSLLRLNLNSFP